MDRDIYKKSFYSHPYVPGRTNNSGADFMTLLLHDVTCVSWIAGLGLSLSLVMDEPYLSSFFTEI